MKERAFIIACQITCSRPCLLYDLKASSHCSFCEKIIKF